MGSHTAPNVRSGTVMCQYLSLSRNSVSSEYLSADDSRPGWVTGERATDLFSVAERSAPHSSSHLLKYSNAVTLHSINQYFGECLKGLAA